MVQPGCIASFASRGVLLHLFTQQALETVLDKNSVMRDEDKLDGFDIHEWAAFAKKKSSIASSICKELGRLKASQSATVDARYRDLDPLCVADPWAGASFKLGACRSKHEDESAEVGAKTAPPWQKYFLKPSEQNTKEATQEAQAVAVQHQLSVEEVPSSLKAFANPSEPDAEGAEKPSCLNDEDVDVIALSIKPPEDHVSQQPVNIPSKSWAREEPDETKTVAPACAPELVSETCSSSQSEACPVPEQDIIGKWIITDIEPTLSYMSRSGPRSFIDPKKRQKVGGIDSSDGALLVCDGCDGTMYRMDLSTTFQLEQQT